MWNSKINYPQNPRVNSVTLLYVVQSQAAPDRTADLQGEFIVETNACVPLIGAHFQANKSKVHQLLKKYLVAEMAE